MSRRRKQPPVREKPIEPEDLPPTRFEVLIEERQNEPWVPYARELLIENQKMIAVLEEIRDHEGKVCDEFETCKHRACNSSFHSWARANEVLRELADPR